MLHNIITNITNTNITNTNTTITQSDSEINFIITIFIILVVLFISFSIILCLRKKEPQYSFIPILP